jgi:peroxiredoxin
MVKTPSTMVPLGTKLPAFALADVVTGATIDPARLADQRALLVMFVCRHCPYVKHVQDELARLGRDYQAQSLAIVAISANDAEAYPDDAPASLRQMALELHLTFPLCYDESQEAALAFHAACTPDFFLYDHERRLVYRGQLDDSRPGNDRPSDGHDLRAAIDAVLAQRPVAVAQRPSMGCNIKWKPGREPDALG